VREKLLTATELFASTPKCLAEEETDQISVAIHIKDKGPFGFQSPTSTVQDLPGPSWTASAGRKTVTFITHSCAQIDHGAARRCPREWPSDRRKVNRRIPPTDANSLPKSKKSEELRI